jgi:hypothetical protein
VNGVGIILFVLKIYQVGIAFVECCRSWLKKREIRVIPCYRKDDGDDGYWHLALGFGGVSLSARAIYLEEKLFYFLTAFTNEKK